jgi:hypothetical protein
MNQEQKNTETVLIVNPNSCSGLTGKNWETLYNQITEIFGENPEVAFSQKSGDGTTLTRNFLRKKFNKIVALGGDGTINEVANGFFEEISLGNSSSNDQTTLASPILKPINPGAVMALVPSGTLYSGILRARQGEVHPPWPCFMVAATTDFIGTSPNQIKSRLSTRSSQDFSR